MVTIQYNLAYIHRSLQDELGDLLVENWQKPL